MSCSERGKEGRVCFILVLGLGSGSLPRVCRLSPYVLIVLFTHPYTVCCLPFAPPRPL